MRIISKWTDYYDHEVAYYGYDETRIYDRRNLAKPWPFNNRFLFHICGKIYPVVEKRGKFYFDRSTDLDLWDNRHFEKKGHSTDVNQKLGQPVLEQTSTYPKYEYGIPILAKYGFPSIIDSRTMYGMIYDYLGWLKDNPPPPDNQTDKQKVVSHGFDPKRSFRPKMKKTA